MSKAPDAWMPLYIGDYLGDTMHLTGPEHGAYLLLIMHYWRNGPLPDQDMRLATIARTDPAAWAEMSTIVRAFFHLDNGVLRHRRIDAELAVAHAKAGRRSAAGRKAGRASAERRAEMAARQGNLDVIQPNVGQTSTPSQSPSPSQSQAKPSPREGQEFDKNGVEICGNYNFQECWEMALTSAGFDPTRDIVFDTVVRRWLLDDIDPGVYCPVIERIVARPSSDVPRSFAYFDRAVREAARMRAN